MKPTNSPRLRNVADTVDENEDGERSLRRKWEWILEEKLHSWHRDSQAWPQKRTYRLFREWFDVRLVSLVFDLADEPLFHEEF